ncbi:hypothetical protein LX32DRAFT_643869 [Colletotrichum zoysiae]|uniref:Uncharacterized protein n=1 Tax=Colletotrichum zoysiae TaxID=1216348 RepID=A0AAD9LZQ9_9PEZI|nr:hypothetical protein LX32DRAFT_643869 [Colletotrichum zoysiae]
MPTAVPLDASGCTLDIVATPYTAVAGSSPSATTYSKMGQFVWCDKQLTELDWATYLDGGGGVVGGLGSEGGMHYGGFAFS